MGLPEEKIERLREKVSEDVKKVLIDNHRDLKKHEVSPTDISRIMDEGGYRGIGKYDKEKV